MTDEKRPRSGDDDAAVLLSLTRDFLKLDPEEREKASRTGEETIELDEAESTGGHRSSNPDLTLPRVEARQAGARPVTRKKTKAKTGEGRGIFIMRALLGFMVTLLVLGVVAGLVKKSRKGGTVVVASAPKAVTAPASLDRFRQEAEAYFAKEELERDMESFQALLAGVSTLTQDDKALAASGFKPDLAAEGVRLDAISQWRARGTEALEKKDWKACAEAFAAWATLEPDNPTARGFRDACRGKAQ